MIYISGITVLLSIFLPFIYYFKYLKRPDDFPPGPRWYLPFVGNYPLIRKLARKLGGQHEAFEELTKIYKSPIVGMRVGREFVVFALGFPLVREVYNREEFEGRPDNFFFRLRTMGKRLGVTFVEGPIWHEQRSFVVRHLKYVGFGKSRMVGEIQNETNEIISFLEDSKGAPIELGASDFLALNVMNILWLFTTGVKIGRDDARLQKLLILMKKRTEAFDISGGHLNQMPWLRFIAPEATGFNLIKSLNTQLKEFFVEIIDKHVENFSADKANDDLIYAFLNEMKKQKHNEESSFTIDQLMMIILDIFFAGAQLTSVGIDLVLMMLIIYPEVQQKVHEELKIFSTLPSYSNRDKLPYLQAVINETFRYFTFFPVGGPRRTLKETTLAGYKLPKHTTVLLGLQHVHMDASYWKDPKTFRPERFLEQDLAERLVTFAFGRRKCLGDQLAKECIFSFIAGILKNFSLHKCDEALPSLKLRPGLSLTPKPFKVSFKKL